MAEVEQPYSTKVFNTLPQLWDANAKLNDNGGMDFVNGALKEVILKHQLEDKFGVGLLHRHFDLNGNEKLVEFNNIATPWGQQDSNDNHTGGKIVPTAWAMRHGRAMPYELAFSPLARQQPLSLDNYKPFMEDFDSILTQHGLQDALCLRQWPGAGYTGALEITEGRANVNLMPDEVREENLDSTTETMWFFNKG